VHKHLGLAGRADFDVSPYTTILCDNLTVLQGDIHLTSKVSLLYLSI
jgi:hypothetical protein